MIIALGLPIFCASAPSVGGSTPSAPTLVTAAIIGWQGSGSGYIGDVMEITSASAWTGADSVTQQWQRFNGSAWEDISGATGSTYAVTEAEASRSIRLLDTASNAGGDTDAPSSNSLTALALSAPASGTDVIAISNTPDGSGGQILTVTPEAIFVDGNPLPAITLYEWFRIVGGSPEPVSNDGNATLEGVGGGGISPQDGIYCVVTWSNSQGSTNRESSHWTP